jgi:putative ABC transport system permease protein
MSWIAGARARVREVLWRRAAEERMDEEIRFHIEMETEKNRREGMSPGEARRRAVLAFGGVEGHREEMREGRRVPLLEDLWWDGRYAVRSLRKNPGFSAVTVLTLALGIGASTGMFTLVNSILLRPLDYPRPERLVVLWEWSPGGDERNVVSPRSFFAWREQAKSFAGLAATWDRLQNVTGGGEAEQLRAKATTGSFFSVLGARAQLGRTYRDGEEEAAVAVLGHRLWRRRFGGDPAVVGRTITLDGQARTVVGVMPADFPSVGTRADLWVPVRLSPETQGRTLQVVGRLRPGTTLEEARREMSAIGRRLAERYPASHTGWGVTLVPMHEQVTGDVRPALLVLLGAVGLLLLIACANVANLLLGRAAVRRKEMAVRLSLGATRARLIRQTLTESLVLAGGAGLLGLGLAVWGTGALVRLLPPDLALPRLDEVRIDGRVLGFALGVSLLTGVLFGITPALFGSAVKLAQTLRETARGTTRGRSRIRKALVVVEVALAVVLLVGAGLLGRSLQRLLEVDTGVRPGQVLTMRLWLSGPQYQEAAPLRSFMARLLPRLEALPGARSAGAEHHLPLTGDRLGHGFHRADRPPPGEGERLSTHIRAVAGDYFTTMGIPLLRGRAFAARDHADAPPVAVVNEELARRYFPGEDPIGKRVRYEWSDTLSVEIVGVVGSVREMGPREEPAPAIYRPYAQMPTPRVALVIRAAGDPLALAAAAAAAVREIDPAQPVAEVRTMEEVAAATVARPRLNLYLLGGFAAMALLLAALGLYGVVSYSVTQRSQEIGVRIALGARPGHVLRLVVREGMRLTVLGLLIGLGAALAATHVMESLLFGVSATDPLTLAGVSAFVAAVALLASYLPAFRATRLDPMAALRAE